MKEIDYDLIHRYLRGELPPAEVAALEEACVADPALQAAVELERKVLSLVRYDGRRRMRAMLRSSPRRQRRGIPAWAWVAMGAAAAVAALLIVFQYTGNAATPQRLADQYFAMEGAHDIEDLLRGDPSHDSTAFDRAMRDYQAGQYRTALQLLSPVPGGDSSDVAKVAYLQGDCWYRLDEPDSAIRAFQRAESWAGKSSSLRRSAMWHLSLALLKSGQTAPARQQLVRLQTEEGPSLSTALRNQIAGLLTQLGQD